MNIPLRVFAAGSLRKAFNELRPDFTMKTGIDLSVEFGPAGLLRQKIEHGDRIDLFASANSEHPLALKSAGLALNVAKFAGNSLSLTLKNDPSFDGRSWLDILLDPNVTLAISTPVSDPSGDYAWQLFDRIERLNPGCGERLKQKAKSLVGGVNSAAIPRGKLAAEWLIDSGQADAFIGYSHYEYALSQPSRLLMDRFPDEYQVPIQYMLATFSERADSLMRYILSEPAQKVLAAQGFQRVI